MPVGDSRYAINPQRAKIGFKPSDDTGVQLEKHTEKRKEDTALGAMW